MNAPVVAAWVVLLMLAPLLIVAAVGVLVLCMQERGVDCDCETWRPSDREIAEAVAEWEASQ